MRPFDKLFMPNKHFGASSDAGKQVILANLSIGSNETRTEAMPEL
jgi:hypothetical protein